MRRIPVEQVGLLRLLAAEGKSQRRDARGELHYGRAMMTVGLGTAVRMLIDKDGTKISQGTLDGTTR